MNNEEDTTSEDTDPVLDSSPTRPNPCTTLRWILHCTDTDRIVYSNDAEVVNALAAKYSVPDNRIERVGYYHYCTNTIEEAYDLCNFDDPRQYLTLRSHNQPHKG